MNSKMTKRDYFNAIVALATENGRDDIVAFAEHEIKLLSTKSKTETALQKENKVLVDRIYDEMEVGKDYTVTEMLRLLPCCADLSSSKVNSMLIKMRDTLVNRKQNNGKTVFSKIVVEPISDSETDEVEG